MNHVFKPYYSACSKTTNSLLCYTSDTLADGSSCLFWHRLYAGCPSDPGLLLALMRFTFCFLDVIPLLFAVNSNS